MIEFDSATLESVVTDNCTDLEERDVRALTEKMSVIPEGRDIYSVSTESGREYTVNTRERRCNCPDGQYHDPEGGCKHLRRVKYATGETPLPAWGDIDAVDNLLGEHVKASPRVAVADGGDVIVAGDDAETLDGEDEEDGRPENCDCGEWNADSGLSCWPCYREGFKKPASAD
jgi:hypothetical protein